MLKSANFPKQPAPSSNLQPIAPLTSLIDVTELPDNHGWSATVRGDKRWGSCWGANQDDAIRAMTLYMQNNYKSLDVLAAVED